MSISQTTLYCKQCGGMTLHQKSVFGIGWGLFLTAITGGFFIPFWILLAIVDSARPYRCLLCTGPGRVHPSSRAGLDRARNPHAPGPEPLRGPFPSASPTFGKTVIAGPFSRASTLTCRRCHASLPDNARFCRDCGAPLRNP